MENLDWNNKNIHIGMEFRKKGTRSLGAMLKVKQEKVGGEKAKPVKSRGRGCRDFQNHFQEGERKRHQW